jgi:Tfp pilus assembly protein PilN
MRRLNLDYRQDQRLLKYCAYFLMVTCFLMATLVLIHYLRALSENSKLNSLIDKVEGVAQPNLSHVKESQLNPETQKELIAYSNQVITKLNMPNLKKGVIKLSGEAKNFKGLFDYMRALNAKSGMDKVYLLEHKINDQDPDQPVHFTLEASWISKP